SCASLARFCLRASRAASSAFAAGRARFGLAAGVDSAGAMASGRPSGSTGADTTAVAGVGAVHCGHRMALPSNSGRTRNFALQLRQRRTLMRRLLVLQAGAERPRIGGGDADRPLMDSSEKPGTYFAGESIWCRQYEATGKNL